MMRIDYERVLPAGACLLAYSWKFCFKLPVTDMFVRFALSATEISPSLTRAIIASGFTSTRFMYILLPENDILEYYDIFYDGI
ncbi:MAG: hypothetical protein IIY78_03220 [Clostridia bacterium]|nr:hypothetical protein [Clostridia bacterium]